MDNLFALPLPIVFIPTAVLAAASCEIVLAGYVSVELYLFSCSERRKRVGTDFSLWIVTISTLSPTLFSPPLQIHFSRSEIVLTEQFYRSRHFPVNCWPSNGLAGFRAK